MFETTLTVPTPQLREIMARLRQAGFAVYDTGHRVMTDDSVDGEATVRLVEAHRVEIIDPSECELGISA